MAQTPPRPSGSGTPLFSSNAERARYWQVEGMQAAKAGYPDDAGEAYGHYLYYQHLAKAERKRHGRARKAAAETASIAPTEGADKEQAHFDAVKKAYEEKLEATRRDRAGRASFGKRSGFLPDG